MIPQRLPDNDMAYNGVRDRVTACRKRLRENRVMCKPVAGTEAGELFPEAAATGSRSRAPSVGNSTQNNLPSVLMEEEVGIT